MKEKIEIRKATRKDAKTLQGMWLSLAKEMLENEGFIVPSVRNAHSWVSFVLEAIEKGQAEVLLASRDKEPVGFLYFTYPTSERYQTSLSYAVIHDMYVKPNHRKKNIGTRLLEETLRRLKRQSIENVRLNVLSDNARQCVSTKNLVSKCIAMECGKNPLTATLTIRRNSGLSGQ